MKKIIIIFLIILIQPVFALAQNLEITGIETNIFGYDYDNETDIKRVERIENYLYGTKKSGNINKRIENIKNDIGYVNEQHSAIKKELPDRIKLQKLKEDASVEYPMVDKLEETLFKTTYKTEDIYKRLDRLEQKVFMKISNDELNDRVDKLASVVLPKKTLQRNQYDYSEENIDKYYRTNGLESVDNQSLPFQLAVLEQDLFKNNYERENIANRLDRLEQKLFNRTFSSDTDITRLQRIMVAYDAKQKSYKYENNRKMQNMATASQLGGILLMILAMIL